MKTTKQFILSVRMVKYLLLMPVFIFLPSAYFIQFPNNYDCWFIICVTDVLSMNDNSYNPRSDQIYTHTTHQCLVKITFMLVQKFYESMILNVHILVVIVQRDPGFINVIWKKKLNYFLMIMVIYQHSQCVSNEIQIPPEPPQKDQECLYFQRKRKSQQNSHRKCQLVV